MIYKTADDKKPALAILEGLLTHPQADAATRKRIEQEMRNIRAGERGEAEAAYEMKVHFGDSENWVVIHDLRIEHGGLVAQIDHLLINRMLVTYVCESKHFSEGVSVNEHGEFTAFFGSKPYGVASPIEQNNRHMLILNRLFESGVVELPKRMGMTMKPELKSLVLVANRARITRPKDINVKDIEVIIKSDMLRTTINKNADSLGIMAMTAAVSRVIGQDTLRDLGKSIAKLHKPIAFDWHGKFGLAKPAPAVPAGPYRIPTSSTGAALAAQGALATPVAPPLRESQMASPAQRNQHAQPIQPAVALQPVAVAQVTDDGGQKPKQKLICHTCAEPVPYAVAKFCWFNKAKFGGNLFCRECQAKV